MLSRELEMALIADLGHALAVDGVETIAGGCIGRAYRLRSGEQQLFLKRMPAAAAAMLQAEAVSLDALRRCRDLRVPQVLGCGTAGADAYLLLEYIELRALERASAARLGSALASLHEFCGEAFGWPQDNWIGASPQYNGELPDWSQFFRQRRLQPQLALARANGLLDAPLAARAEQLLDCLPDCLAGHRPQPSLLHGDLWAGNLAADASGRPVIYDPASYYGDAEADLAMTRLFGALPDSFYDAYHRQRPRLRGWRWRTQLYNLYHVLNHLNLFAGGYARQALSLLDELLETRPC